MFSKNLFFLSAITKTNPNDGLSAYLSISRNVLMYISTNALMYISTNVLMYFYKCTNVYFSEIP